MGISWLFKLEYFCLCATNDIGPVPQDKEKSGFSVPERAYLISESVSMVTGYVNLTCFLEGFFSLTPPLPLPKPAFRLSHSHGQDQSA